jgi:hypothetical protein
MYYYKYELLLRILWALDAKKPEENMMYFMLYLIHSA